MLRSFAAMLCLAALPAAALSPGLAAPTNAEVSARVLPGWRLEDGTHMAALELRLAPGWKTYWRAPGDIGIPPRFDWRGSGNLRGVEVEWPTPERIDQGGMSSIGYHDTVILPLHVLAKQDARDVVLRGTVDIGVCQDICIPLTLELNAKLPAAATARDGRIIAALADRPLSAEEANVHSVICTVTPGAKGGLALRAELSLPPSGGTEIAVIETEDPDIWIAPAHTTRQGDILIAETTLAQAEGRPFALDRSKLRLTILGTNHSVDIKGCPGA